MVTSFYTLTFDLHLNNLCAVLQLQIRKTSSKTIYVKTIVSNNISRPKDDHIRHVVATGAEPVILERRKGNVLWNFEKTAGT